MIRFLAARNTLSLALSATAVLAFQALSPLKAYAHYPIVAATVSCVGSTPVISYTVSSWDQNPADPGGTNPAINVFFNGAVVDTEAFLSSTTPADQFSNSRTAPQGTDTVDVYAQAASAWGDGQVWPTLSNTVTLTIPTTCAPGTGRFTGGGKEVDGVDINGNPVSVTEGFEVDCDLHQPSNNLEVNWTGGNHFHMEDFLSAVCTFVSNPKPPVAPVNTIVGSGTGRVNNTEGYTIIFELVDNGEPGKNDELSFKIYQTANPANVVLTVPLGFITKGNIQAHIDQQ